MYMYRRRIAKKTATLLQWNLCRYQEQVTQTRLKRSADVLSFVKSRTVIGRRSRSKRLAAVEHQTPQRLQTRATNGNNTGRAWRNDVHRYTRGVLGNFHWRGPGQGWGSGERVPPS